MPIPGEIDHWSYWTQADKQQGENKQKEKEVISGSFCFVP
jgi:endo-alpha-1,4-polygalactosaminidase (GH114 family)